MAYLRNEPVATDDLTVSQPKLATNTNQADDSFGVDHYKFSDTTPNNGFHNQVTTPGYVATPPTGLAPVTTTNPIFYGFQDSANVGLIQYSRGPSNVIPTPLTNLNSTAAAIVLANNATTNILDFATLTRAIVEIYAADTVVASTLTWTAILWTGAAFSIPHQGSKFIATYPVIGGSAIITPAGLQIIAAGSVLQLKNVSGGTLSNVYWTMKMLRLQ